MKFKNVIAKIHDSVLESDDTEPKPKTGQATKAALPEQTNFNITPSLPSNSPFSVPNASQVDEKLYQRLLDKTNFNNTSIGKLVYKYFEALDGAGLDTNTQIKTAIKQASKIDGVTPAQILQSFEDMKAALQQENDTFAQALASQDRTEIKSRRDKLQQISVNIDALSKQISDLQADHTKTSAEMVDKQNSAANAQTKMQLASARRQQEIEQQKIQFAGLLQ